MSRSLLYAGMGENALASQVGLDGPFSQGPQVGYRD